MRANHNFKMKQLLKQNNSSASHVPALQSKFQMLNILSTPTLISVQASLVLLAGKIPSGRNPRISSLI